MVWSPERINDMSVEWLKGAVPCGAGKSTGLTFREQDERDAKLAKEAAKEDAKKRKVIKSKIETAIKLLREAILLEMDELVEKHREKCRQCKKR